MNTPRALAVLEAGIHAKQQIGAQLFVSLNGETLTDVARGLAAAGKPMTPDSMMTWLSCSKIAASVAFAIVWERGLVGLDDAICRHIPEFAANGKEAITIRQAWTHTMGLADVEPLLFKVRYANTNEQNIALICEAAPVPGWTPGRRAFYQTSASFLLLAEIARRVTGRDFRTFVREEVFIPLGMTDSWLGMPEDRLVHYADRLGQTPDTSGPEPRPGWAPDRPNQLTHLMPGGNGRGPMRELARLLEMLRCGGSLNGTRLLTPQTVQALIARSRTGMVDEGGWFIVDIGLGLTLDSKIHHGGQNCVSGYGRYASANTFGHNGTFCCVAMCDPDAKLVVCNFWNGTVGDNFVHLSRQHSLLEAIYEDLGLAR